MKRLNFILKLMLVVMMTIMMSFTARATDDSSLTTQSTSQSTVTDSSSVDTSNTEDKTTDVSNTEKNQDKSVTEEKKTTDTSHTETKEKKTVDTFTTKETNKEETEDTSKTNTAQPITFKEKTEDKSVTVNVVADADAFPEGTTMKVVPVDDEEVIEAVKKTVKGEVKSIKAVDITFYDQDGNEIEPTDGSKVSVTITNDDVKKVKNPIIVHIIDNNKAKNRDKKITSKKRSKKKKDRYTGEIIKDINTKKKKKGILSFDTESFSIYAVVDDGTTDTDARMTLNFWNLIGYENLQYHATPTGEYYTGTKNGNSVTIKPIAAFTVKNEDKALDTDENDLEQIIRYPGAGVIPEGALFMGWSISKNLNSTDGLGYTTDETTWPHYTIPQVRDYVRNNTNWQGSRTASANGTANWAEGDILNVYAIFYDYFTVTFEDEADKVISVDNAHKTERQDYAEYTVDVDYDPYKDTESFAGWRLISGTAYTRSGTAGNYTYTPITKYTEGSTNYSRITNGTKIYIPRSATTGTAVRFEPDLIDGHWLVFHQNGAGASYNAPRFYGAEEATSGTGLRTVRNGYTFYRWEEAANYYTEDTTGADGKEYKKGDPVVDENGNIPTTGSEFHFGSVISEGTDHNIHLVAQWHQVTEAPYSVVIWLRDVNGTTYDYQEEIVMPKVAPGTSASNAVNVQGTIGSNNSYARINNTNYQYTGFHLDHYDQGKTVNVEGNTVVNVYYNRNSHTFTYRDYTYTETTATTNQNTYFGLVDGHYLQLTRSGNNNNNYRWWYNGNQYTGTEYTGQRYTRSTNQNNTIHTVTRLYGQDISDIWTFTGTNGATYPQTDPVTSWQPSGSTTYTARITSMQVMPNEDITFTHTTTTNERRYFHYYVEALESEQGAANHVEGKTYRTYNGTDYVLYMDLPNDFNVVYYNDDFWNLDGFTRQAMTKSNNQVVTLNAGQAIAWDAGNYQGVVAARLNTNYGGDDNHLYFYYTRNKYNIKYEDGTYFGGQFSNEPLENYYAGTFKDSIDLSYQGEIQYEGDISPFEYDPNGTTEQNTRAYDPTADMQAHADYHGFIFAGWYADPTCNTPYDFNTMPSHNVTVYAKWIREQYRVYLDSGWTSTTDTDHSLDWGDDDVTMCFRVDYLDTVSTLTGKKDGYTFLGWYYKDANGNEVPYSDSTKLTQYFPSEDYDMTVDKTDPMDKYGQLGSGAYNSDLTGYDSDGDNTGDSPRFWVTKKVKLVAKWRADLDGMEGIEVQYEADGFYKDYNANKTEFTEVPITGDDTSEPQDTEKYGENTGVIAQTKTNPLMWHQATKYNAHSTYYTSDGSTYALATGVTADNFGNGTYYTKDEVVDAYTGEMTKVQFDHWVVQKWDKDHVNDDGTKGAYVDATDSNGDLIIVSPAAEFTAKKALARPIDATYKPANSNGGTFDATGNTKYYTRNGDTYTEVTAPVAGDFNTYYVVDTPARYVMQLRAEYVEAELEAPTHIVWYANGGYSETYTSLTGTVTNETLSDGEKYRVEHSKYLRAITDLEINRGIPVAEATAFVRPGYKFLGWSLQDEDALTGDAYDDVNDVANVSVFENNKKQLASSHLFLSYNSTNGKYYKVNNGTVTTQEVTKVAADEDRPYNVLYAVWARTLFDVNITKFNDDQTIKLGGAVYTIYGSVDNDFTTTADNKPIKTITTGNGENGTTLGLGSTTIYAEDFEDTDNNGNVTHYNYFFLKETTPPSGYQVDDTVYQITVSSTQMKSDDNSVDLTRDYNSQTYLVYNVASIKPVGSATGLSKDDAQSISISNNESATTTDHPYVFKDKSLVDVYVVKTDNNQTSPTYLAGANFNVTKNTSTTVTTQDYTAYHFKTNVTGTDTDEDAVLTSSDDPKGVPMYLLEEGDYHLTEAKAPDGYYTLTNDIDLKVENGVVSTTSPDTIAKVTGGDVDSTTGHKTYTITITNTPGEALPFTGGAGTLIIYVIGLMLTMTAGIIFLSRRRLNITKG